MDILLVNPPWHKDSGNIWKNVSACLPPFGLAILASLARSKGFSVSIIDCNAERIGLDKMEEILPKDNPKFVGITATTVLIDNALELAKIIKRKYPKAKVIMGGVHSTVRPKEVLEKSEVDFVVMGEGEHSFLDLLSGGNPGEIKGIGFKENGRAVINESGECIPDINVFPLPAYDLLPMERYYPALGSYKRKPSFGMITSRGCPGRCTFCKGNILGEVIRFKSPEKIIEEIEYLQKNYGIKDVTFYDDTFTSSKKRVMEFCRLLKDKSIDLTWCCFSRVDTVDLEMLREMKKAGCYQMMYGVESADPQILANINKRISLEKVEETVANTKKAGIEIRLAFMLGNPGETEETIQKTINYAIFLDPDLVSFNITTPYPGTEMFEWARRKGYLIHEFWSDYNLAKPVMDLPTIDSRKVLRYYKKAHRQFYFRPGYILKRLIKIRSFGDIKKNFQPFISLIKFNLSK
ncbi:MAG: radical SAM protein [Candidatus Portnoybacteria bacterium]